MGRNFRCRVAKATVRWKKLGIMTSKCNMLWEMLAEGIIKCFFLNRTRGNEGVGRLSLQFWCCTVHRLS